jgi:tetratricopeptide (TPR) repeat protein
MLATPLTQKPPDLDSALGKEGEKEYRRLLRVLRMARGQFFLFPVECDFPPRLRDALLARLYTDLKSEGSCLRVVTLTRDNWDMFSLPGMETPVTAGEVVALVGLEDTPGITPELGAPPRRPPALALLNLQRDGFRTCLPAPLLVWCPPHAYNALLEHAPDFFDHYSGLFHFMNAASEPAPVTSLSTPRLFDLGLLEEWVPRSPALVDFYRQQVEANPAPSSERARALIGLAEALWNIRDAEWPSRFVEAKGYIEEALGWLARKRNLLDRYQWARGQIILGNILCGLSGDHRAENIRRAIACYNAALRVYTETRYPREWVMVQNNLGNAYTNLPYGDREKNLQQAIACYQATLRITSETEMPLIWATTQNNLGTAYAELKTVNRSENLHRAIACFEAALRIHSEDDFPTQWALTQSNIGNAYSDIPDGDKEENLRRANACYEAALRVFTEQTHTYLWANTHHNMALNLWEQRRAVEALQHIQLAVGGFHSCRMEDAAHEAEEIARSMLTQIERLIFADQNR